MRDELISDLDAFFGKNYSNFDLISALPSYEPVTIAMLLRSGNRVTDGQNTVNERRKICYQPHKDELLAELKERYVDNSFTYSFRVAPVRQRINSLFAAHSKGGALILRLVKRYGEEPAHMPEKLGITPYAWKKILRGYFLPEKELLFKLCLTLGTSREDGYALLKAFGAYYDFEDARDVVVRYLTEYRVFNRDMIDRAFEEYKLKKIL